VIKISAIISTYNGERFLRSRLDNLLSQTVSDEMEIVVVDSGSLQNELAILNEYGNGNQSIRFIRTEREGLYAAWNRAVKMARGEYLTNANVDDRLRSDALETLVDALERAQHAALSYGDMFITENEEDIISCKSLERKERWIELEWPDFSHRRLLLGCICGPQPVWRRSLHTEFGLFDESYTVCGDWEFWLRVAEKYPFVHVRQFLGLNLKSTTTIQGANTDLMISENKKVRTKYFAGIR
jgi:glycosyltransferase involved in cell wall biosynthesis